MILVKLGGSKARLLQFRKIVQRFRIWPHNRHSDVNALAVSEVLHTDRCRDYSAPVSTLGQILIITKTDHEFVPGPGNLFNAPAGLGGLIGETKSG